MANTIKKLTIEGFKSIRKLEDFPLFPLNVLRRQRRRQEQLRRVLQALEGDD